MSVVYSGLAVAIILVFVVQFRPGSGQSAASLSQQCAITIGDRCVDPKDYNASVFLAAQRGMGEGNTANEIRRAIADGIIERVLLAQDAERLRITVSDEEIDAELANGRFHVSIPVLRGDISNYLALNEPGFEGVRRLDVTAKGTGIFDYKAYTKVVRENTGRSPAEFRLMQREELIAKRMRQLIASRASVTDSEAFDEFKNTASKAQLAYIRLDKNYYAHHFVDTSQKTIDTWAGFHRDEVDSTWAERKQGYQPGCVRVRHILVRIKTENLPIGHERSEGQALIEKAKARLAAGVPFPIVVIEDSEDYRSHALGGVLGCITKGSLPEALAPLEEVVLAQTKPGLLDTIVETPYGFHLVDIEAVLPTDERKAQDQGRALVARDLMIAFVANTTMVESAKRIQQAVQGGAELSEALDAELARLEDERAGGKKPKKKDPKDTDEPIEQAGRPFVETTASFSPTSENPFRGVAPGVNVVEMAFRLGAPGQVAPDLVQMTNGYAIIQLKDRHIATRDDFDAVRSEYMAELLAYKQYEVLNCYVDQLRKAYTKPIVISEKYILGPKRDSQAPADQEDQ
ncbi:MAG: SurA N-terminal domain-containing protein [Polyangiaceae bacterium]|nr:SurA N-terminal domain-containing protein [Polyangiaceae bacterium]